MKLNRIVLAAALLLLCPTMRAQGEHDGLVGQRTPSFSEYFSWINNTNEGATEQSTLINFNFFRWLKQTYGMQLDIYAFDAGALDGAKMYGSMLSPRFHRHFPNGFAPIADASRRLGFTLGLWGGPDGFGDTETEAQARMRQMESLAEKYNFRLFKFDAVCGQLRPSKYGYFDQMMTNIRRVAPNFILLNHRLDLGPGTRHSTTYLMGGNETYIDVFMTNDQTASHHRAKAMARELPKELTRQTEDHGVCLSSCLDGWEDDLILQAFNRSLILAPEIYGNPWLLRDDEFPRLAYIFNLHRDYRDLLVDGKELPESQYGLNAVARGNGRTQFITLRNLSWETKTFRIDLDQTTGITERKPVSVRLYHPYIQDLGTHAYGSGIEVSVEPFSATLVKLSTEQNRDRVALTGIPYRIVNDRAGQTATVELLAKPGQKYKVRLETPSGFTSARLNGALKNGLLQGKTVTLSFKGNKKQPDWHYHAGSLQSTDVPADAEAYYWATAFAADNNALEARSLLRSGETKIPEVKAARDAFFGQRVFRDREIWDKYLFDGDPKTAFSVSMRWGDRRDNGESSFLLDLGEAQQLDSLTLQSFDEYSIAPLKSEEGVHAQVSADLKSWRDITFIAGTRMQIPLSDAGPVRYVRFSPCPLRLSEVNGYAGGKAVDRSAWRASNLFSTYGENRCVARKAWTGTFTLNHYSEGDYLCIAVNGSYGGAKPWAAVKIDGRYVGCPDRAPSFNSNTWEYLNHLTRSGYTYYLPLSPEMVGKQIEATVLLLGREGDVQQARDIQPELWVTKHEEPFIRQTLTLERK